MTATAHDRKEAKSTPMRAEKHMRRRVKHSLAVPIQIKTEMPQSLFVKFSTLFFLWPFDTILGHGFPLRGFAITLLVTPYSIEILWTSDQTDEDIST